MTTEIATFAAGCFWGTEHIYNKHFKGIETKVGYTGGSVEDPRYEQVKKGSTDHAEALEIKFDPAQISYESLVEFFYKMHDPTTLNYQGPDVGSQYRSAIFYHSPEQKQVIDKVTTQVQKEHYPNQPIVTEIVPFQSFHDAEKYHQFYLERNPDGYACPTHYLRW
ncbi:reductase [Absidia repens]|uniref:peptide-methionine (S)-S-oxide reductase n=1 Tax=Absidia repens TaxID=90262 RepID=A0A1X2I9F2_9FUNG|nr:reductase [Absidia repens]